MKRDGEAMPNNQRTEEGFAERLRLVRTSRGLSQAKMAQKANVHYTHISKYECGRSRPSLDTLQRLADVLGVSADYLLHGAENDAARAKFQDTELLRQFQEVQGLGERDKRLVKEFIDAFLTKKKLEQLVAG